MTKTSIQTRIQMYEKKRIKMYEKNILKYWSGGQPITALREHGVPFPWAPQS